MPPKKGQKMDLNAFLQDESFGTAPAGDWADEEMPLPTSSANLGQAAGMGGAPRDTPMDWNAAKRDGPPARGGMMMDRPPREPREPVPIPDKPPFTARLVNLDYSVTEQDIAGLFDPAVVASIRVPQDVASGRPRGFAFVEFDKREALEQALDLTGTNFLGRELRVFVAEKGGGPAQDERLASNDWRAASRSEQSEPDNRDYNNWDRRGPLPPLGPSARGPGGPPKPRGRFDEEFLNMSWERKGPLPPRESREPREPREQPRPAALEKDDWRSSGSSKPAGPGRPKIQLKPRTVGEHAATPAQSEARSSSLFGSAKPVDTTKKLLEIEEQSQKEEQAKLDAAREQKERIQAEKDEKKQKEAERAEQARKRFNLLSTDDKGEEEEEEAAAAAQPEKPATEKKSDVNTAAEKMQNSEASKEELESGDWEVVNRRK